MGLGHIEREQKQAQLYDDGIFIHENIKVPIPTFSIQNQQQGSKRIKHKQHFFPSSPPPNKKKKFDLSTTDH